LNTIVAVAETKKQKVFLWDFRMVPIRAGLKPMYPMQLHWAPRLWGSRAMVVGQVVHFCQVILALKNYRNGCLISMLENSYLLKKRRCCTKELYQMCSTLMLGRYVCAPACSSFYGWNLVGAGVR